MATWMRMILGESLRVCKISRISGLLEAWGHMYTNTHRGAVNFEVCGGGVREVVW
jgi:hypothetical protein